MIKLLFDRLPQGNEYNDLLDICLNYCCDFSFIVDVNKVHVVGYSLVLKRLTPFLVSVKEVDHWPGSCLEPSSHLSQYTYQASFESVAELKAVSRSLSDWTNPDFPEDLYFTRQTGEVFLGTTVHDLYAWITCSYEEYEHIKKIAPTIIRNLITEDGRDPCNMGQYELENVTFNPEQYLQYVINILRRALEHPKERFEFLSIFTARLCDISSPPELKDAFSLLEDVSHDINEMILDYEIKGEPLPYRFGQTLIEYSLYMLNEMGL